MSNIKIEHVILVNNKIKIPEVEYSKMELGVVNLRNEEIEMCFNIFNNFTAYKFKYNSDPKKIFEFLKKNIKYFQI